MTVKSVRIEAETDGIRIDMFLANRMTGLSRSGVQRLIERGLVILDGKPVRKNHKITKGEAYYVTLPEPVTPETKVQEIPLDVVYEDIDVIVVNKPRGMVVHPSPGHPDGTLVNALLAHCGDSLSGIGGARRPGIVHRIDKDTSGLVIAAKNDDAHMSLSVQLKSRTLSRVYEAIVLGSVKADRGTIDAPIGRHPTNRKRQTVTDKHSRNAVTHYEVLGRYNGYTHVRCRLETGRTHQIRTWPISAILLGDTTYGRKKLKRAFRQCLHARELNTHPEPRADLLKTELPPYFTEVLKLAIS